MQSNLLRTAPVVGIWALSGIGCMLLVLVRLQSYPELNAVPVRNIAYDCLTANDCQWSAVVMPRLTTWRDWLAEHSQDVYGVVSMAARLTRVCAVRSSQWLARGWLPA